MILVERAQESVVDFFYVQVSRHDIEEGSDVHVGALGVESCVHREFLLKTFVLSKFLQQLQLQIFEALAVRLYVIDDVTDL